MNNAGHKVKTTHGGVVRISRELDEQLNELSELTGRSKAYYVTYALQGYLKDMQAYMKETDPRRKELMARELRLIP